METQAHWQTKVFCTVMFLIGPYKAQEAWRYCIKLDTLIFIVKNYISNHLEWCVHHFSFANVKLLCHFNCTWECTYLLALSPFLLWWLQKHWSWKHVAQSCLLQFQSYGLWNQWSWSIHNWWPCFHAFSCACIVNRHIQELSENCSWCC